MRKRQNLLLLMLSLGMMFVTVESECEEFCYSKDSVNGECKICYTDCTHSNTAFFTSCSIQMKDQNGEEELSEVSCKAMCYPEEYPELMGQSQVFGLQYEDEEVKQNQVEQNGETEESYDLVIDSEQVEGEVVQDDGQVVQDDGQVLQDEGSLVQESQGQDEEIQVEERQELENVQEISEAEEGGSNLVDQEQEEINEEEEEEINEQEKEQEDKSYENILVMEEQEMVFEDQDNLLRQEQDEQYDQLSNDQLLSDDQDQNQLFQYQDQQQQQQGEAQQLLGQSEQSSSLITQNTQKQQPLQSQTSNTDSTISPGPNQAQIQDIEEPPLTYEELKQLKKQTQGWTPPQQKILNAFIILSLSSILFIVTFTQIWKCIDKRKKLQQFKLKHTKEWVKCFQKVNTSDTTIGSVQSRDNQVMPTNRQQTIQTLHTQ